MFTIEWFANFGFSVLRLSTPLIFAALAAAISKKAGMLNRMATAAPNAAPADTPRIAGETIGLRNMT